MANESGNWQSWFSQDDCPDPYMALQRIAEALRGAQGEERETDADNYLQLYLGSTRWRARGSSHGNISLWPWSHDAVPSLNIIQAITDTMVGMTLRQRVRPFFLTEGGSFEMREKAQAMQLATEGQFRADGTYDELGTRVCYDGHIYDGGGIKSICDYANHRIICERVLPWQVLVPEREGVSGKPTQMFHVYPMPRASLLAMHDKNTAEGRRARDIIKDAKPVGWDFEHDPDPIDGWVSDEVLVIEGWHLPSGRVDLKDREAAFGLDAKGRSVDWNHDGRHSIIVAGIQATESGTLRDEAWPFDYFPISWFLPQPYPSSFWSRSVPQTLCGLQAAMHRMNRRVDRILHLHSRPQVYVWKRANVNLDKIDNDSASIIEGDVQAGQAIQTMTPTAVPGELVERIRELGEWAQKQFGVSDQSVQANRPPGIEHAPAMQHLQELETVRHTPRFRAWERLHVHKATTNVDMFRMLAEHDQDFEIVWGEDEELRRIKWKSVDLGADRTRVAVYPTNLLPLTPGAKIERLIQLVSANLLPPEKATAMLFEYPDVKAALKNANAERTNIEYKLSLIVKDGDYAKAMPSPYLNLDLAQLIALEWINQYDREGLDPKKLQMLRRWHRDITRIKQRTMPAPLPPAAADASGMPAGPQLPSPAGAPTMPAIPPGQNAGIA